MSLPPTRRSCLKYVHLITVEPAFALFFLSYGLTNPTDNALIYNKSCLNLYNDTACGNLDPKVDTAVQVLASKWQNYMTVAYSAPAVFTMALYGHLGDRFGRKLPLMLPILGEILCSVGKLVNSVFMDAPLGWLLIPQFVSGVFAGRMSFAAACYTYIAEVTHADNRALRMIVADSLLYIASGVTAFVSGLILEGTSFQVVYAIGAGISLLAMTYIWFALRDIKPTQRLKRGSTLTEFPRVEKRPCLEWLKDSLHLAVIFKQRPKHHQRLWLAAAVTTTFFWHLAFVHPVLYLYFKKVLGWDQTLYGYFMGVYVIVVGCGSLFVVPFLKRMLHVKDTVIMIMGTVCSIAATIFMAFCSETWMAFMYPVIDLLHGAPMPAVRGFISTLVRQWEQGKRMDEIEV